MKYTDRIDWSGMGTTAKILVIGMVVLVIFLAGFWGVLRMAGGGEDAGQGGDPVSPAEDEATTNQPVVPDTTEDEGARAVEGNPDQPSSQPSTQ